MVNMLITVYSLNALAKVENGGNPAGVVLAADGLSEGQMKAIAAKVGYSETAFFQKSEKADLKLRFFTPVAEVDLCGHATIASFYFSAVNGLLEPGIYLTETRAGLLNVEIKTGNTIFMNQNLPVFGEEPDHSEIAASLGIPVSSISNKYPCRVVSTGLRDIMVPVASLDILQKIQPDPDIVSKISKAYNTVGYHIFSLETLHHSTAHCRNLAPLYGIPEEAATGTSSGALSCYLYHYKLVDAAEAAHMVFEQGYTMGKPSEILASLTVEDKKITSVRVGGTARDIQKITVEI